MNYNELCSTQQIHARMRALDPRAPGLSTTYRSLEILLRDGYLQAVDVGDGERRYELVKPGEHHHHLICKSCNASIHMEECVIMEMNDKIASLYGFHVKQHVLEIFGKCATCLARHPKDLKYD